jgi:hypothetical protein
MSEEVYNRSKECDAILRENSRLQCSIVGTDMHEARYADFVGKVKVQIDENLAKLDTVDPELYALFQRTKDK